MSLLNGRSFTLLVRRGTHTSLLSTDTYAMQGEPLYTTDTQQLYIANNSNKAIPVNGNTYPTTGLPTSVSTGERAFVTDATTGSATFLSTPVNGGSTFAPVFYDGNKWRVG